MLPLCAYEYILIYIINYGQCNMGTDFISEICKTISADLIVKQQGKSAVFIVGI